MGVSGNWNARFAMRLGDGAQDSLHTWRYARRIRGALQNPGLHSCVRDALADVAHEHFDHQLRTVEYGAGSTVMEVERDVVIGVNSCGDDDVERRSGCDALDARNVAAEADHGEIDHRLDAARGQFVHARGGFLNAALFRAPGLRIILHDLGGEHEDVFVHEGDTEVGVGEGSRGLCLWWPRYLAYIKLVQAWEP